MSESSHWQESSALVEYEKHFNLIQAGIRGLASTWMLAAFGGFSFFLHPEVSKDSVYTLNLGALPTGAYYGLGTVGLLSFAGLLVLWTLDQLVYHRLLLSGFLVGLCLEYVDRDIPPVRWVMAASDRGREVTARVLLFYMLPMVALFLIGVAGAAFAWRGSPGVTGSPGCFIFPLLEGLGFLYMFLRNSETKLDSFFREKTVASGKLAELFPGAPLGPKAIVVKYRNQLEAGEGHGYVCE